LLFQKIRKALILVTKEKLLDIEDLDIIKNKCQKTKESMPHIVQNII